MSSIIFGSLINKCNSLINIGKSRVIDVKSFMNVGNSLVTVGK